MPAPSTTMKLIGDEFRLLGFNELERKDIAQEQAYKQFRNVSPHYQLQVRTRPFY